MTTQIDTSQAPLSIAETATALGVSQRTVWRYLKSGRLSGTTVGAQGSQRTLVSLDSVDAVRNGRGEKTSSTKDLQDLQAQLTQAKATIIRLENERDALAARVEVLQSAARRWPGVRNGRINAIITTIFGAIAARSHSPQPGA